jgi:hypothetical protein
MISYVINRLSSDGKVSTTTITDDQLDMIYDALGQYKENLQYNELEFDELTEQEDKVEALFESLYELVKVE